MKGKLGQPAGQKEEEQADKEQAVYRESGPEQLMSMRMRMSLVELN